jgi:ribosome-associated protein
LTRLVRKQSAQAEPDFIPSVRRIAALAADYKAADLIAYDVRGLTLIADSFVVCTAQSEPQMRAIVNGVRDGMKEIGVRPYAVEGTTSSGWLVIDFSTIIFHVFRGETRAFYDLDGFWADAPKIALDE